jgi:hypothetical protein
MFNVSDFLSLLVFSDIDFHVVTRADWRISVRYHDSYDISGTFMTDDMTDHAVNTNLLPDSFYLHLSIELIDWVPYTFFFISRAHDGSLPLSNEEISELGISVNIEPQYWYCQQLHSLPDAILALYKHYNISDPQTYMLRLLERLYGQIHFFPEPNLPPHWERQISDEEISYFYNRKTFAWVWIPAEAFACMYFSSSSFKESDLHDDFDIR